MNNNWALYLLTVVLGAMGGSPDILEIRCLCPVRCNCNIGKHNVVTADCSKGQYSSVPGKFPASINVINMDGNNIIRLRNNTFVNNQFKSLKKISFSKNRINKIEPNAFAGLNTVQNLDLSDNNIKKVQADTFLQMSRLSFVNLQGNIRLPCHKLARELQREKKIKVLCDKKTKKRRTKKGKPTLLKDKKRSTRAVTNTEVILSRKDDDEGGDLNDDIVLRITFVSLAVMLSGAGIFIYCWCGQKNWSNMRKQETKFYKVVPTV